MPPREIPGSVTVVTGRFPQSIQNEEVDTTKSLNLDESQFKELVRDALMEVSYFTFRVTPGFLKMRQVFRKNEYTWVVGFWAKSYGPEIEVIQTPSATPRGLRALIVGGIEENLREWKKIAEERDKQV